MLWERLDSALARAADPGAIARHRLDLVDAQRRRRLGLPREPATRFTEVKVTAANLAVRPLLERMRAELTGQMIVVKGPEVALDYPEPGLRPFWDLDVLTADAPRAQAALIAAGFEEVGDPAIFEGIHHLRPLWWPGLALCVELHERPKWPEGLAPPPLADLLAAAVPGRLGVDGVGTLPPAEHAVLLAGHAWAHEPLERLGHLVDIAVTLERTEPRAAAAVAERWGCARMWRTTYGALRAILYGERRTGATSSWARHLIEVRDRTVLEDHLMRCLSPAWGLPGPRGARGCVRALAIAPRREGDETWRAKFSRTRLAVANARKARSEHQDAIATRGGS
jgi:hypothetical protein